MFDELFKEGFAIAATPLFPASQAAGAIGTGAVDMSKYNRVAFVGALGTLGANATVAAWLQQTNNSDGSGGAALGTNVALSTNFSAANASFSLELLNGSQQLTARYVTCNMAIGVNACVVSCIPLGYIPRNPPVTDYNTNTTGVQRIAL